MNTSRLSAHFAATNGQIFKAEVLHYFMIWATLSLSFNLWMINSWTCHTAVFKASLCTYLSTRLVSYFRKPKGWYWCWLINIGHFSKCYTASEWWIHSQVLSGIPFNKAQSSGHAAVKKGNLKERRRSSIKCTCFHMGSSLKDGTGHSLQSCNMWLANCRQESWI